MKKLALADFIFSAFLILGALLSNSHRAFGAVGGNIDGIVYVLSGGPIDLGSNPNGAYERYLKSVQNQLPNKNLYLKKLHNSNQDQACHDIIEQKTISPRAIIVLAGHSYGSDGAIWVSRCLEQAKIDIDLLLTADTIARNGMTVTESLTPPENVKLNFHYYQQTDPMLQGSGYNRRQDGSFRNIYNFKQDMGSSPIQSHLNGYKYLIDYGIHPTLAVLALLGTSEAEMVKQLEPLNKAFFKDHPQVPID